MQVFGIGDLASSLFSRRNNARLSADFNRLGAELSSGRVADISKKTNGQLESLASVQRSLVLLDAYSVTASKVEVKLGYQQAAMGIVGDQISTLGSQLLAAAESGATGLAPLISSSSGAFHTAVSALTTNVGGVYVFSGVNSDTPPLGSADEILESLRLVVSGATTADDFWQKIDDWFNLPRGFDVVAYQGGDADKLGAQVSDTERVGLGVTGEATGIRHALRDLAAVSLMASNDFQGSDAEYAELGLLVGSSAISSNDGIIAIQAEIGSYEQRLIQTSAQNSAQKFALSEARNGLLQVDPFETASRLEEVQFQLESLYLVTAKTARLNLTEYLR